MLPSLHRPHPLSLLFIPCCVWHFAFSSRLFASFFSSLCSPRQISGVVASYSSSGRWMYAAFRLCSRPDSLHFFVIFFNAQFLCPPRFPLLSFRLQIRFPGHARGCTLEAIREVFPHFSPRILLRNSLFYRPLSSFGTLLYTLFWSFFFVRFCVRMRDHCVFFAFPSFLGVLMLPYSRYLLAAWPSGFSRSFSSSFFFSLAPAARTSDFFTPSV